MSGEFVTLAANLARVRERIERAASRAGRRAEEITLIGVSKMHPAAQIRELYEAGIRHFGENRVQEWESKLASLADLDATWHLIGHLQSNKVARAVRMFHSVDSVDSVALAERLERAKKEFNTEGTESTEKKEESKGAGRAGRQSVLLEVRLDPVGEKSGVSEGELPHLAEAVLRLPLLELRGLMGVPPYFEDPEKVRPFFTVCANYGTRCARNLAQRSCQLSRWGCHMTLKLPSRKAQLKSAWGPRCLASESRTTRLCRSRKKTAS